MSGESTGFGSPVCWPFQPFRLNTQSPARGESFWPQSSFCAPQEIGSSRRGGSAQCSVAPANGSGWEIGGARGGGRGGVAPPPRRRAGVGGRGPGGGVEARFLGGGGEPGGGCPPGRGP